MAEGDLHHARRLRPLGLVRQLPPPPYSRPRSPSTLQLTLLAPRLPLQLIHLLLLGFVVYQFFEKGKEVIVDKCVPFLSVGFLRTPG